MIEPIHSKDGNTYWMYRNNPYTSPPEECAGFVYLIHNLALNKLYVGKKLFWTVKKLPPLKGKKNKRHKRVQTDWRDYWGSNTQLQQDVQQLGAHNFRREIIHLCANKNQMSYYETLEQFNREVLLHDNYYNGIINCRVTNRGLDK